MTKTKLKANAKRDRLHIRIGVRHRLRLEEVMEDEGINSLSEWVRRRIDEGFDKLEGKNKRRKPRRK